MTASLPFDITPQVRRYLEELTFSDEYDFGGNQNILIETFSIGERLSQDSFANIEKLLEYLKDSKIIRINTFPKIVVGKQTKRISPANLKIDVLDQKALQDLTGYVNQKNNTPLKEYLVRWIPEHRILIYGDTQCIFREKTSDNQARLKLFKFLWENRRYLVSGKTELEGKPKPARFVANHIEFCQDTRIEEYNARGIQRTGDLAKDLGRYLIKKGFPIKISTSGGFLLTVKEQKRSK
jgi:hypothetical protein